jgi:hypothetical protein
MDLARPAFGPLELGTPVERVRELLGRPTLGTWFQRPPGLWYRHLALAVGFDAGGRVNDVQLDWSDEAFGRSTTTRILGVPVGGPREPAEPNPLVRLRSGRRLPARRLDEHTMRQAFGPPKHGSRREGEPGTVEWRCGGHRVYLDLGEDGAVQGVGFMAEE